MSFIINLVFVVSDEDMKIIVEVCNSAVCTTTGFIPITICEENEEERDESIQLVLENVSLNFLFFIFYFLFFIFLTSNCFFGRPKRP